MVPLAKIPIEEYLLQQLESPPVLPQAFPAKASGTVLSSPVSSNVRIPGKSPNEYDEADISTPTRQSPAVGSEFPTYAIVVIAAVFFTMTATFIYFLCRCMARKKKRENQLANLTPQIVVDPRMAGVRANQPIEFVVPTTVTILTEQTTEDSVSETDYSSSGQGKSLPSFSDRGRRKRSSGFQIDPADLQHGLYVGVTAASSSAGNSGPFPGHLGRVGFSLRYNLQRGQLTVKVIGARDLPCHSTRSPCVKLVLLPERTTKYVTKKVPRNTASPSFDESFVFCVRRDQLPDKKLKISVWDHDRFSRKCLIGQVVYNVRDSGLTNTLSVDATSGEIWADLNQDSVTHPNENGEILLSLCYDPDSATLTLGVLKTRGVDMQPNKGKETSIYAKVSLYVRQKLVRTKKTSSRKKAPELEFNSPFSIHVPQPALKEVDLMVALCEKWPLGKRVLGRTQTGTNCLYQQGLQHWQDMLAAPKSTCAQWHTLCG